MPLFLLELLLHTAVEEERYVRVLLGLCVRWVRVVDAGLKRGLPTSDVRLLDVVFCKPLRKHVCHCLWREGDFEGELGVVP